MPIRITCLAALALLSAARVSADVHIVTGPTPIPGGNARARGDLTVVNEHLAFALAVESPVPYGVPRGAIIDVAPVRDGSIGTDKVVFADFIPNNWSAWPNTYQHVEVLERGPQQVRISVTRDWGKVKIATLYTLRENSDRVQISTTMTNEGLTTLTDLLSGLTLWPSSGYLFAVPGLAGVTEGSAQPALARRVSAYDADWAVTLHATYLDHIGSGSRDMFLLHTLQPGESRTFEGWLQVSASGDLAPAVVAQIERDKLAAGTVHGAVRSSDRRPLAQPVVVIEKDGKPYAWVLGHDGSYSIRLPIGEYSLYATGRNYSRSAPVRLLVVGQSDQTRDFADLNAPGRVEFAVTDAASHKPLDARISIAAGDKPVVEFLGRKTFFTELAQPGHVSIPIAPGRYGFLVSTGAGFLAQDAQVEVVVEPGGVTQAGVPIRMLFDPPARGWYSADLHHHADQAEAVTPPEDLARSQLAAGLDLLFVSDHDSTANHATLSRIGKERGVAFIPGIELSPSWGHFNAYPLDPGTTLAIDTSTASIDGVLKEARREGAAVVQVNHPFIPFGYFTSVANGVAPGGFNGDFDLIEMNATAPDDDAKVLAWLRKSWNAGRHYYLSAGSDTHDVWNAQSGLVRVFAHLDTAVSAEAFAQSLKAGHAYVSHGPLIFPAVVFGSTIKARRGVPVPLEFELDSVAGMSRAELVSGEGKSESRTFDQAPRTVHATFEVSPGRSTWYQLVTEDAAGRKAYADPIWLEVVPASSAAAAH